MVEGSSARSAATENLIGNREHSLTELSTPDLKALFAQRKEAVARQDPHPQSVLRAPSRPAVDCAGDGVAYLATIEGTQLEKADRA